jgi:hypothetical protein
LLLSQSVHSVKSVIETGVICLYITTRCAHDSEMMPVWDPVSDFLPARTDYVATNLTLSNLSFVPPNKEEFKKILAIR